MTTVVVLAALLIVGYYLSLLLHPYMKCEVCKGTGKHTGSFFTHGLRLCHRCSGTGRKQRLGAFVLQRGQRRRASSRIAPRIPRD